MKSLKKQSHQPKLRFTPYAWAKLLFLRDAGPTEVGAFGITAPDDLLLVRDLVLVHQHCTVVTVAFEDAAVADNLDAMVDQGLRPEQCMRLWIHTHPGDSPAPSLTDEETFARCFGSTDWSVMFILAKGGDSYARMQFRAGPGGAMLLPVDVAFNELFEASQQQAWLEEYAQSVFPIEPLFNQLDLPLRHHALMQDEFPMSQDTVWEDDLFRNYKELIYEYE